MNVYIISTVLFLVQFLFSNFIGTKIKPLIETNKKIKEELNLYIEEKEKQYNLNKVGIFRLRVLGLFAKIKDEDEKEEIRNHMKTVVKDNNGHPKKIFLLFLTRIAFSLLCIYYLILFVDSEPVFWLSIVVNILVIFFWISRKRWIFSIIFAAIGYIVYPHMPGHLLLYIGLNMIKTIITLTKKKS